MKNGSRATIALVLSFIFALAIIGILYWVQSDKLDWFPQALVTLAALVGASWFAGNRLDLFEKDSTQRYLGTERANFNHAIKEAVEMLSKDSTPSVIAGQRWLHSIANVGPTEAGLVQALLCNFLTDALSTDPAASDQRLDPRSCQSALDLLFRAPDSDRFSASDAKPELGASHWRDLDFSSLNLRAATCTGSDFTDATINGTDFSAADLCNTQWSQVGGNSRTTMRAARLCGAEASSASFVEIDFQHANLSTGNRRTRFRSTKFTHCDFQNADWRGAIFEHCIFSQCKFSKANWLGVELLSPTFTACQGLTYELCAQARMQDPRGLPADIEQRLRKDGLVRYSQDPTAQ